MPEQPPSPQTQRTEVFVFLPVPGVSMMSLASAIEPLRSLNRLTGLKAYEWRLASLDGGPVQSSNEIPLPTVPSASALAGADYLIVCAGLEPPKTDEKRYLALLRNAARQGGLKLGALSTGAYLLARAGLLNRRRCTIHWESRAAFREEFPDIDCTNRVYEIDRDRLTSAGGTAAMDMMLHLIGERFGEGLARDVANQFHHEHIRGAEDHQRGPHKEKTAHLPAPLRQAVAIMEARIEDPIPLSQLADAVFLSERQVERLFKRHLGQSPLRYYAGLRLEHARDLLIYSDMPLLEVAVSSGFASVAQFSAWYRRVFGHPPSQTRVGKSRPDVGKAKA